MITSIAQQITWRRLLVGIIATYCLLVAYQRYQHLSTRHVRVVVELDRQALCRTIESHVFVVGGSDLTLTTGGGFSENGSQVEAELRVHLPEDKEFRRRAIAFLGSQKPLLIAGLFGTSKGTIDFGGTDGGVWVYRWYYEF